MTQEPTFEERKYLNDIARTDAQWAHDNSNTFHTYINQATIDSGNLTLRTLVLINGGAAVSMLALEVAPVVWTAFPRR